jgi:PAS domain-containing protein
MDSAGGEGAGTGPITHGICPPCAADLFGKRKGRGTPLRDFLESLEVPTLLVDREVRVQVANPPTLEMVGKSREEIEGYLPGEVFRCVNADLPGGCGQTELCSACTVRNTVNETYETGESRIRVPATLRVRWDGESARIKFLLTTEKAGERVLVQVEPAGGE